MNERAGNEQAMNEQQDSGRRDSVTWAAGVALDRLHREVGTPGLPVLRRSPALLAVVDQHAAQVRDTLAGADGVITVTALAGYADGVLDIAVSRGVDPFAAARAGAWHGGPWALMRLLAVCLLAGKGRCPG
jgi:hypothetical protein